MFKELFSTWKKEDLLSQALKGIKKTMRDVEIMFNASVEALVKNKEPEVDIFRMDKKINDSEIDIRQKVLEHITLNPKQEIIAFLTLIDIIRALERIGDLTKNIAELNNIYPSKIKDGKYAKELREMKDLVLDMFGLTKKALEKSDESIAGEVINLHNKTISLRADKLIEDLIGEKKIPVKNGIVYTLFARYLKRTSAHLMSISSSVSNPYHKIRSRPENDYMVLAKKMKDPKNQRYQTIKPITKTNKPKTK